MNISPKNWLLLNRISHLSLLDQKALTCLLVFLFCSVLNGQTFINLVPNGSFETYTSCPVNGSEIYFAVPWTGPTYNSSDFQHACANPNSQGVPYYNGVSSPYPLYQPAVNNGNGYAGIYTYALNYREYLEVPLTSTLEAGKCYYSEFYAVSQAIVKYCANNVAGSFGNTLHPTNLSTGNLLSLPQHIINYNNPIIKDTLNWQKISGIYQANGTESVFTIGNFKDDSNTDTINSYLPGAYWYYTSTAAYIFVDAVSVYSINPSGTLPWTYRDTTVALGDSVYIGNYMGGSFNPSWYTYSGIFIANNAGIFVKPSITSQYVVQYSVCGVSRSDTITVTVTGVGISELDLLSNNLKIYPQPATNEITLQLNLQTDNPFNKYQLYNNLGQLIREEELSFKNNEAKIDIAHVSDGVYSLKLQNSKGITVSKRIVIAKQ